ncbi:hypothetical protein MJO28_012071 [Puccinia striiformis f. sp. tritici]|uniref:Uncharacterized protein n=1 Tax=Puccinia striiformis f. sp. tritici TaxID=168172 RepID=A0ACC0E0U2_9BASI|nr:hypothetical protein MJO28_012071 [Puccinia striiformis f. sp. tritici]
MHHQLNSHAQLEKDKKVLPVLKERSISTPLSTYHEVKALMVRNKSSQLTGCERYFAQDGGIGDNRLKFTSRHGLQGVIATHYWSGGIRGVRDVIKVRLDRRGTLRLEGPDGRPVPRPRLDGW